MEIVHNDSLTIAFKIFCEEMKLDSDKLSSCFEFTIFLGFRIINPLKYHFKEPAYIVVNTRIAQLVKQLVALTATQ